MNNLVAKMKKNWRAGLTVSLVSIPLSISLSLAGGGTPQMGIITAIWAGLVASILGGSNYNITGPTGALSGILASYALLHGVSTLPLLAICSGLLILIVFLLHLEKYIVLIPASVLHGFTLGVAFVIGLGQLNSALGISPKVVHETFIANFIESLKIALSFNPVASVITLIGVITLLIMRDKFPKFPAVIALAAVGILLGIASSYHLLPFTLSTIQSRYGVIPSGIALFPSHISASLFNSSLFSTSVAVAIVAILETLISGRIADGMTKTRFNPRKELLGLGTANIASGLFGGLPATAALARTSLNVKSGADNKISASISSIAVAVISIVLLPFFQYLPLSIVAATLMYVAINMVKAEHFHNLYRFDKKSFFIALLVALITVVWDPITGIGVGAIIALLLFINQLAQASVEVNLHDVEHKLLKRAHISEVTTMEKKGTTIVYRFAGELMYINAQAHRSAISQINGKSKLVILSLRNLYYIDIDGAEILAEIIDELKTHKKDVAITGVNTFALTILEKRSWFRELEREGKVFATTIEALKKLKA